MRAHVTGLCALACALAWLPGAARATPEAVPAIEGVLQAFHNQPLVALGDMHLMAEEGAFYIALVSDPRFAATVQDIVVEFGAGGHQAIIDRYLNGESVPYDQLRLTWTDTVGAVPTENRIEFIHFFAAVRAVNMHLSAGGRIRVWLGQPPIEWSTIHSRAEERPLSVGRDRYPADLIEREIMAKGRKALLIWGQAHFADGGVFLPTLGPTLRAAHPGSLYYVTPYFGFNEAGCDAAFEGRAAHWPTPAVIAPLKGSATLKAMRKPGCTVDPGLAQDTKAMKPEQLAALRANDDHLAGVDADALLYLGKEANMTVSPVDPTFYLDDAYFQEMSRRNEIMIGKPLDWAAYVAANPPVLEYFDAHIGRRTAP
jgi:hypothetical protein